MPKVEAYQSEEREVAGTSVLVTSYRIGETYACVVYNKEPGAAIARGRGSTREEAVDQALTKAGQRLGLASRP